MITTISASLIRCQLILPSGLFILCLFSGCNLSKQEIPEPNYHPFVLGPGIFYEAQLEPITSASIHPPDTVMVKSEWINSERLEPKPLEGASVSVSNAKRFPTAPVPIDLSKFEQPIYIPSVGIMKQFTIPPGIRANFEIQNEQYHYIAVLDEFNDQIVCLEEDRFGRIWIGGDLRGVSIWDGVHLINLSPEQGFPDVRINEIFEDSRGNMWLATAESGVLVWNGVDFKVYNESNGLSDNRVSSIEEDWLGKIWIGTKHGLNVWDGSGFYHYYTEQGLTNNSIGDLEVDRDGSIWIGTWGGGLNLMNESMLWKMTSEEGLSHDQVLKILSDTQGNIWISLPGPVQWWDGEVLSSYSSISGFPEDWTVDIIEDSNGRIWMGGDHGVSFYEGNRFHEMPEYNHQKYGVVSELMEDSSGRIWIGTTHSGIHVLTNPGSRHIASDESLWWRSGYQNLAEDSQGNIWALSRRLGLVLRNRMGLMDKISLPLNDLHLPLLNDSYGNMLIGADMNNLILTNSAMISQNPPKLKYYHLPTKYSEDHTGMISSFLEDSNRNLLIGTKWGHGLFVWDRSDRTAGGNEPFLHYGRKQGLEVYHINTLVEDRIGRIWIGTDEGLFVWDGVSFQRFKDMEELCNGRGVSNLSMDHNGNIWIATWASGIGVWDGNGINWYNKDQGLPTNIFKSIKVDQNNNIWAGSQLGLIKLWTDSEGKVHYKLLNEYHGVGRSIINDILVDQDSKLWVISQQKLDIIDLKLKTADTSKPKLAMRGIQPFFNRFDWRKAQQSISNGELLVTGNQEIPIYKVRYDSVYRYHNLPIAPRFPHNINHLSFEWGSTYWDDPNSIRYSYQLSGLDQTWSPLVRENKVTYTSLQPGEYTLKLRAVAGNAQWSETVRYSFTISPPLWATWYAYGLYALCALGLVIGVRHYEKKRFILRQKAKSLEEIDQAKSEFFTNISHELRTPLTLILGPLKALKEGTYGGDKDSIYTVMSQNGRRLLQLINQLLDLSKVDQGKLKLEPQDCNMNELVQQVLANFDSACCLKKIELEFHYTSSPIYCRVDQEKIRQVLYNLVSNAIKFTPENGHIKVSVASVEPVRQRHGVRERHSYFEEALPGGKQHTGGTQESLKIVVKDSGVGVPKNELDHIFDRFYQVKNTHQDESEGTGIGLALAQKLVQLHEGTIEVESEPGWGTTFTVCLPLIKVRKEPSMIEKTIPETDPEAQAKPVDTNHIPADAPGVIAGRHTQTSHSTPTLLLVEDNAQMREYIRSSLGENYQYLEASNGEEGLKMALDQVPDLILCDVMMPKMDGFGLCLDLRKQEATAHIPFIFLTARADLDSRLQGLEIGSNDYVTKPFEPDELRLKVRNHLDKIQQYRQFFSKQLAINGDIDPVQSLDSVFLNKAIEAVQQQLDNHGFTVQDFSRQLGLSNPQLYRKLMALTGQSPSIFIRSIRLKKAAQLIIQHYGNTSEVAYAVGFNNLSYFTKCFKEQFGVVPSGYGKKHIEKY